MITCITIEGKKKKNRYHSKGKKGFSLTDGMHHSIASVVCTSIILVHNSLGVYFSIFLQCVIGSIIEQKILYEMFYNQSNSDIWFILVPLIKDEFD